jgi:aminoglycoside phosphotransferase (APT) family kinase protein
MRRYPEVERIFARHSLGAVSSVVPLAGGQLNTAVRVSDRFVLRYREPHLSTGSLRRETVVLKRLHGRVPTAEVLASGLDDILGEYVIQKWVPGVTLLEAWLENPDVSTREWWLTQWTASLRAIHEERFSQPGEWVDGELKAYPSWRSYMETRLRKRIDLLMRVPAMDRDLVLAAERYLRRKAPVLEDAPFCLIHRDLHFGNVLVKGPQLTAVLDFELAQVGPRDYELDAICRFLRYPWFYLPAGSPARVHPARFASVWMRLRRGYPELFAAPRLRERLCLYALDRELSCLIRAYAGRWGSDNGAEAALWRLGEIFADRYGPE